MCIKNIIQENRKQILPSDFPDVKREAKSDTLGRHVRSLGSRGDMEPFLALGEELQTSGKRSWDLDSVTLPSLSLQTLG